MTQERLMAGLREIAAGTGPGGAVAAAHVGDVRGRGLAIGLDLVSDRTTAERDGPLAQKVVYRAWQLGAVVFYVGSNVLEITPPLVISDAEVDRAVEILGQAIADAVTGKVTDEEVAPYVGW